MSTCYQSGLMMMPIMFACKNHMNLDFLVPFGCIYGPFGFGIIFGSPMTNGDFMFIDLLQFRFGGIIPSAIAI